MRLCVLHMYIFTYLHTHTHTRTRCSLIEEKLTLALVRYGLSLFLSSGSCLCFSSRKQQRRQTGGSGKPHTYTSRIKGKKMSVLSIARARLPVALQIQAVTIIRHSAVTNQLLEATRVSLFFFSPSFSLFLLSICLSLVF